MLMSFLQAKFTIREIAWDTERFPHQRMTTEQCRKNAKDANLIPEYWCFAIERNDASEPYYEEISDSLFPDMVYIIFEEKSGFLYTNSNRLFTELHLLRGLTMEDVLEDPVLLEDYVCKVKRYLQQYAGFETEA